MEECKTYFVFYFGLLLQEVSYCQLLVPSEHYFKKPRRQFSEQAEVAETTEKLMHPGVARCFSYEPATHKATAHYIPHNTNTEKGKNNNFINCNAMSIYCLGLPYFLSLCIY